MSNFKENPQDALKALQEIADEIASCVSAEEISKAIPILAPTSKELYSYMFHYMCLNLRENLSFFWAQNAVEEKLMEMKKLEENASSSPVRRPKTGIVDSEAIRAACLLKTKKLLENKIKDMRNKSDTMKREIDEFNSLIAEQMKSMQTVLQSTDNI